MQAAGSLHKNNQPTKMDEAIKNVIKWLSPYYDRLNSFIAGCIASVFGYLLPVKDIVHLMLLFFVLDVIFGAWAAKKVRKEKFSVKIIWNHTMPRMLLSIVMVLGAYMWDDVYNQDIVCTYKIVGWFISGVLLWSIAENGYKITKWSVFPKIGTLFRTKVKDSTGMDISDEKPNNNENS